MMLPSSTPSPACPSCGSDQVTCVGGLAPGVRFAGQPLEEPLPGGRLYRCAACHLMFRAPVLTKAKLDALYRRGDPEFWDQTLEERMDWTIARRWLTDHLPPGRALDIGCFNGAFLETLEEGWERYGIEINEPAAHQAEARGVTLVGRDVSELPDLDQRFDVITAFDLIEHFQDPRALLGHMADRVRPGGVVILGTGNTRALSWRLMGSRYWYCALPEHLAFISDDWCRAAADALGLELAHLERFSHEFDRRLGRRLSELSKNLLLRVAPPLFRTLRASGFGGVDAAQHTAWREVPPNWLTARDHLLAIFRKP